MRTLAVGILCGFWVSGLYAFALNKYDILLGLAVFGLFTSEMIKFIWPRVYIINNQKGAANNAGE